MQISSVLPFLAQVSLRPRR